MLAGSVATYRSTGVLVGRTKKRHSHVPLILSLNHICTDSTSSHGMSFRKRNVVLGTVASGASPAARKEKSLAPGSRPSPLDGRLTTSTGTPSLDQLLAGHAGLPMGASLLIEETGTTDFGGILLRYYAAEGLVHGHHVHLLGLGEAWRRELPGLAGERKTKLGKTETPTDDKMKIAWRYETFGNRTPVSRGKCCQSCPQYTY